MNNLQFLIKDFYLFELVYISVLLDTVFGAIQAGFKGVFNFKELQNFMLKIVQYSIFLVTANTIEYFSKQTGYNIEGLGIIAISGVLIATELSSIIQSIKFISNEK